MKKLVLSLFTVCMCLSVSIMFTACNIEHNHTYKTEWAFDDSYHWHECNGDEMNRGCNEVFDKAEHNWEEDKCLVCNLTRNAPVEGFKFEYLEETDSYEVVGYNGSLPSDIVIPSEHNGKPVTHVGGLRHIDAAQTIVSIVFPDSVTHIGKYAFDVCKALRRVEFGNGIIEIGSDAFKECDISEVYIKDIAQWCKVKFVGVGSHPAYDEGDVDLFVNGEKAIDIIIPSSVTEIASYAFCGFGSIKTITFKGSIDDMGFSVFSDCVNLESVVFESNLAYVGNAAFSGCYNLSSVVLPDSAVSIGERAFADCSSLSRIDLPSNLKKIGDSAFLRCGLLSVSVPQSVQTLENSSFAECADLAEVELSNGLLSIGSMVFSGSQFYNQLRTQSTNAVYVDGYLLELLSTSKVEGTYRVANGTLGIADNAFWYYPLKYKITGIELPDGIRFIGKDAFSKYENLETINFPEGLQSIGNSAFASCGLKSIVLPESLTQLGYQAFSGCVYLEDIAIGGRIQKIGSSCFENTAYESNRNNWTEGLLYLGNILLKADTNLEGEITIAPGITRIANYAFLDCKGITAVNLNQTQCIGELAFYRCSSLEKIYANLNLKSIGEAAFYVSALKDIYFEGTQVQWDSVYIHDSVKMDNITIHIDEK